MSILPTPSVISINAFDPRFEHVVEFIYMGNQSIKNRAVIYDNDNLDTPVYDSVLSTLKLSHIIPANTLEVGKQYIIQIQVFDADDNSSPLSDEVLFHCYSTPQFTLNEFANPHQAANIEASVSYSQAEGETLRLCQYTLYDYNKMIIGRSDIFYASAQPYTFYGLGNSATYYIRCIGETTHGFTLDTGYVEVKVLYGTIPASILVNLENNRCEGYISVDTNLSVIDFFTENDNYTVEDGVATIYDNVLTYQGGFSVDGDFTLYVDAKNVKLGTFIEGQDLGFKLSIVKVCGESYCELRAGDYVIYETFEGKFLKTENEYLIIDINGNVIEATTGYEYYDDFIIFEVKRQDGVYGLKLYYKTETE